MPRLERCLSALLLITTLTACGKPKSNPNETAPARSNVNRLRALPYLDSVKVDPTLNQSYGVTHHDPKRAFSGLNVYLNAKINCAPILDMHGQVVHALFERRKDGPSAWKLIEPHLEDGFIVLIEDGQIFKIDWYSNVQWQASGRFHHDMSVDKDGQIYTVANRKDNFELFSKEGPILDNDLVILTPQGRVKQTLSFAKMIAQEAVLLDAIHNDDIRESHYDENTWDVLHTNTIEVIDRDVYFNEQPLFHRGQVLFCMRQLDLIGIVDIKKSKIVWHWGLEELDNPHHPTLLDDGSILIFDNGSRRGHSRVIQINPSTGEITYEYRAYPKESFYTRTQGSAERFPNGNTLICESENGRVFELAPDGKTVWEFLSYPRPHDLKKRDALYRMPRLRNPEHYPLLNASTGDAFYCRAIGWVALGLLDVGIEHYQQSLERSPKDVGLVHHGLARALFAAGRTEEAFQHFRETVKRKPDWATDIAWILDTTNNQLLDPHQAVIFAQHAADLTNYHNLSILDTLAAALASSGDFERAVNIAERAVELSKEQGADQLVRQIQTRIADYLQQQSYRDPRTKPVGQR